MATNIEITAQLNKMLVEQNQLYLIQAKIMRGQLAVMQQMAEAMGTVDVSKNVNAFNQLNDALAEVEGKLEDLSKSTQASEASVKKMMGTTDAAGRSLKKAATFSEQLGEELMKVSPAALAVDGAMRGLEFSFNLLSGGINILKSIANGVWGVAKALLAMPFEIWDSIMAKAGQPGDTAIAEELENIRRQFGDLRTGSALAVREIAKNLRGEMVGTGLNAARVFGTVAQRMEAVRKTATALGPMFNQLSGDIVENGQAIMQFQKGMGTSDEAMKAFGRSAIVTGRSVGDVQNEYANYAVQLGKAFNINAREITQDMNELVGDMKHFGGMSAKALNETIVYARRLGIEVKNLTGLMDAFDNFDQAADATARLNQQFGIQIDTMEIMKADNPAERAEQLRKAFEASGRSIETLDRRSKSYLASQIGLSEADAELLFAEKNRGRSLDDVRKKAEEAERKQLKQTETLQRLTGSIDRVVRAGQELAGIFDAFFKGFMKGFERSGPAISFMRELRVILRSAFQEGRNLGSVFTEIFPAVKAVMQGLLAFFNPAIWKKTIHTVVDAFRDFFKTVESDPQAGLKTLWERLKKAFFDHFDALSGPGGQMIDGFKRYFKVILSTIAAAARMAIPEIAAFLADALKTVASFVKGGGITKAIADTESIGGQLASFFGAMYDAFKDAVPVIWEGVQELFSVLWSKLVDWIFSHKMMVLGALAAYFAPSVILSVLGAGMGLAGKAIAGRLVESIGTAVGSPSAQRQLTDSISSLTEAIRGAPNAPVAPPVAPGTNAAVGGLESLLKQLREIKLNDVFRAIGVAFALGVFITAGLAPLVLGIIAAAKLIQVSGVDAGSLILATGVFMATGLVVGGLALVAKVIGSSGSIFAKAVGGLAPLGAFAAGFTVVAGILGLLLYGLAKSLTPAQLKAGTIAMLGISATLLSMIPLAAASALIGAAMSGPWALAIGAAAIAGLAALATFAVAAMDSGKQIIDAANSINLTTGIKEKVDLLLSVLGGLSNLAEGIGTIVSAVAIASLDPNDTEGFSKMLGTVNQFVVNTKENAINFVKEARKIAEEINPEEIQKLNAFVGVLQGLSAFMNSISETVKASGDALFPGAAMERFNTQFDNMLITIAGSAGAPGFARIVERALSIMNEVKGTPEQITTSAKALGDVLTALGGFLKNIADLSKGLLENEAGELTNLRQFIGNLVREVFTGEGGAGLLNMIRGVVAAFAEASGTINPAQAESIKAIAGVLGPVFEGISNILEVVKNFRTTGNADTNLEAFSGFINNIFEQLQNFLPTLVRGIQMVFIGINPASLKSKASALKGVVDLIGSVIGFVSTFYWTVRNAGGGMANWSTTEGGGISAGLGTLRNLFNPNQRNNLFAIIGDIINGIESAISPAMVAKLRKIPNFSRLVKAMSEISNIASSIKTISESVRKSTGGATGGTTVLNRGDINGMIHPIGFMIEVLTVDQFGSSAQTLTELISEFNETGLSSKSLQRITGFSRGLGTFANSLKDGLEGINVETANRVRDIAGALSETINELNNLTSLNANTTLGTLSRNLGLGRTQSYTIDNRNFSIVLNLDVKMEAGNFEQVLFRRSEMTAITSGRPLKSTGFRTPNETGGFNLE